jgi:tetratricopeptide (TPR) repeat protein
MNHARRWILVGVAMPVLAAAIVVLLRSQAFGGTRPGGRVAPYRFRLLTPAPPDAELPMVQERLKNRPDSALDLATLASIHLRMRRFAEAEKTARRSLELLPVYNAGATMVLAQLAQGRHDFAEAVKLTLEVLKMHPRSPDALSLLVTANLGRGSVHEAMRWAGELVDRLPTTGSLTQRALALEAVGRDDEALHDHMKAIELEDIGEMEVSSRSRAMLARFHLRRGRLDDARDLLEEALRIDPKNHVALALLGDVELQDGAVVDAERHYTSAFQASGGEAAYLLKKARAKGKGGAALLSQAEEMLRDELAGSAFGHRRTLAEVLLEKGADGEALALMLEESKIRRDVETLELLTEALVRAGRAKEALTVAREALATGVRRASLYRRAARLEQTAGLAARAALYARLADEVTR